MESKDDKLDEKLERQIKVVKEALKPESEVYLGLCETVVLIEILFKYMKVFVDKKMHQVTKKMKTAEKDVKAGKKGAAVKVLKSAEKKNEKLVKIDRDVRDPIVDKYKKEHQHKGKK